MRPFGSRVTTMRDSVVGAWWERYPLEEWAADEVLHAIDPEIPRRMLRPNLKYRFYRVATPLSAHVTLVTLQGEDREGLLFSVGSACRETRRASWTKSILEAIQSRIYVRFLKSELNLCRRRSPDALAAFSDHALFYSAYPDLLNGTVLHRPAGTREQTSKVQHEDLSALGERLGSDRQILFRNMTPPGIAGEFEDWTVLKVLIPGLQPLHGNHRLSHLGGVLWAPRGLAESGATGIASAG